MATVSTDRTESRSDPDQPPFPTLVKRANFEERARAAISELERRTEIQFTWPGEAGPGGERLRLHPLQLRQEPSEPSSWDWSVLPDDLEWVSGVVTFLVWSSGFLLLALATVSLYGGFAALRERLRNRSQRTSLPSVPSEEPPAAAAAGPDKAEILAMKGRYAEALHALLLHSQAEIGRCTGVRFTPSLTSREILDRVHLSQAGYEALRHLVGQVEQSRFGGQPATDGDFQAGRTHYRILADNLPLRGRGPIPTLGRGRPT